MSKPDDALVEKVVGALRNALLWTDEEGDVGPWREEAESVLRRYELASAASQLGKDQEPIQASRHVVPPTDEMLIAGAEVMLHPSVYMVGPPQRAMEKVKDIWDAMIAAAPQASREGAMPDCFDGNRPLPADRETLGRLVREAWVRWAQTQPSPKASWLVPYDDLSEPDKEADRQIGEAIARWTLIFDASRFALSDQASREGAPPSPSRIGGE